MIGIARYPTPTITPGSSEAAGLPESDQATSSPPTPKTCFTEAVPLGYSQAARILAAPKEAILVRLPQGQPVYL